MSDSMKVFYCKDCRTVWETNDYREDSERYGEFKYLSDCHVCEKFVHNVKAIYKNLASAWKNATGPRTTEGKLRTRLNGWKSGRFSEEIFAPAIYGKFIECEKCRHSVLCKGKAIDYCREKLEKAIEIFQAYKEGNVSLIKEHVGIIQARNMQILEMSQAELFKRGIVIKEKLKTQNGVTIKYKLNPATSAVSDFTKILGFNAEQQNMTPATMIEIDNEEILSDVGANEYINSIAKTLENISFVQKKAAEERSSDEVHNKIQNNEDVNDSENIDIPEENPFEC